LTQLELNLFNVQYIQKIAKPLDIEHVSK